MSSPGLDQHYLRPSFRKILFLVKRPGEFFFSELTQPAVPFLTFFFIQRAIVYTYIYIYRNTLGAAPMAMDL